jgi:hypothetical protein
LNRMQTIKFLAVLGVAAIGLSPVMSQPAPETDDQAKLREAMRKSIAEQNAQEAAAPAAPKPAAAPTVVVPVELEKSASQFSDAPVAGDDEAMAKYRAAMRQSIASNPAPAAPKPVAQAHATGKPVYTPTPSEAIPSPFSAAKQQRLDALLSQYKADTITPQEYHAQRAAIIGEP